jgi:hypothetical protein
LWFEEKFVGSSFLNLWFNSLQKTIILKFGTCVLLDIIFRGAKSTKSMKIGIARIHSITSNHDVIYWYICINGGLISFKFCYAINGSYTNIVEY